MLDGSNDLKKQKSLWKRGHIDKMQIKLCATYNFLIVTLRTWQTRDVYRSPCTVTSTKNGKRPVIRESEHAAGSLGRNGRSLSLGREDGTKTQFAETVTRLPWLVTAARNRRRSINDRRYTPDRVRVACGTTRVSSHAARRTTRSTTATAGSVLTVVPKCQVARVIVAGRSVVRLSRSTVSTSI